MKEKQAGFITACIQGDETAISQFVLENQLDVFRLSLSLLNDPAEANEATQNVFIAVLKALKNYNERESLKAWLYVITLNTCRSRLRKRRAQNRLQDALSSIFQIRSQGTPTLEQSAIQNEEEKALWNALGELGEKHRIPLILRYYHEFSTKEISKIMKIKEGTVHSRLSIGREKLRAILGNLHSEIGE